MKRRIIICVVAMLSLLSMRAETVSQKEASALANIFFNEVHKMRTAPPKLIYNGRKLTTGRLFTPFYVYNCPVGGFVIISAENKAFPILGFSLTENFDAELLEEGEKALLTSYAKEIEYIRYDSQPIEATIEAWRDFAGYVDNILTARYDATDPKLTNEEAEILIDEAISSGDAIGSDIYTPEQWRDMISEELRLKECVPLVIADNFKTYPMVIFGRKGDYFRIMQNDINRWFFRLNATEVIPSNMLTVVVNPISLPDEEPLAADFDFIDQILSDTHIAEENRISTSSIDRINIENEPVIRSLGYGHFEVTLPENGKLALVYNVSGRMVKRFTFSETNVLNINIDNEPSGFYVLTIFGDSGIPYSFKLYR